MNPPDKVRDAVLDPFFDQHPNAVLLFDAHGTVMRANAAASWLGVDGRYPTFTQLTGLPWPFGAAATALHSVSWSHRQLVHAADGSSRHVDATLFPADATSGAAACVYLDLRDATASVRAAQMYQETVSRARVNTDSAPVLVWMAGLDHRHDWFNKSWLVFRGRSLVDELGEGWAQGIHPDDVERRLAIFTHCVGQHEPFTMDYRLRRHDGVYRWVLDTALPRFDAQGAFLGYIGSCVDINERRELEDQLAEHARQLRLADQRREDFLARLSHELRNPLAPIANAAAVLQTMEKDDPTLKQLRQIIERQVEQLRQTVTDLVDATRILRGQVVLQRGVVDIDALIDAAVEGAAPAAQRRQQHLRVQRAAQAVCCDGDLQRLSQALLAVLDNAIKFSPVASPIVISVQLHDTTVAIKVQDAGRGIALALMPHVFDLFVQGEQGLAREDGGLGVGLTIARRVLELHGGSIKLDSEGVGAGTVATLRLPLRKTQTEAAVDPCDLGSVAARRVLVVEDHNDERDSLRMRMQVRGNEVMAATTADEALQIAAWFAPQLVVCDIGLPDIDGYRLIGLLRNTVGIAPFHAVALTGYDRIQDRDLALAVGFDSFQVKPLVPALQPVPAGNGKQA